MRLLATVAMAAVALTAFGPGQAAADGAASGAAEIAERPSVVTRHVGVFDGQRLRYTATVGATTVRAGSPETEARLVSYAYTRDGVDDARRPVLFLFNGGPIVPSVYLHMGLGPRRVAFPDDVNADPSTFRLVDNQYSPLDATDLVFVDPASTGFSRVAPGGDPAAFYSVRDDAAQIAAFIREWLRENGRSGAPVYLMGESYGTNRAAEIARQLAEAEDPLPLSGVFLYGQAVNLIEYAQRPANVISYVASLPTIAATGFYHGRAEADGRSFETYMADASAFATGPYLSALYRGSALGGAERAEIARRLQEFSGVPAAWYLANDLKITKERYRTELLKDQGLLLGRSDARYTAPLTEAGGAPDPADVLSDAMLEHFDLYLKRELKVGWSDAYLTSAPGVEITKWGWGGPALGPFSDWPYYVGISRMMALNPDFRLVIGNGYYDTMTTVGGAEMLGTQYGLDPARVAVRYYDGGHMGYSVEATVRALGEDVRTLVRRP